MKQIVNRVFLFIAVAGLVLGLAGLAHGECSSPIQQKPKKGNLKITVPTEVAGVTLEPGEYKVKEVDSAKGVFIEFTWFNDHAYAPEGVLRFDWETVAKVKATMQPQCEPDDRTELLYGSDNHTAIALTIRGSSFDYLF